jgi:translocator assembly and maintenance protein 41
VSAALLLLPQKLGQNNGQQISVQDLFESIAGLSYIGDPRVAAGAEDPMKVRNIVHSAGQLERFHITYQEQFQQLEKMGLCTLSIDTLQIDLLDFSIRRSLAKRLAPNLQSETINLFSRSSKQLNCNNLHHDIELSQKIIAESIAKIVSPCAKIQTAKGLVTAGLSKSMRYLTAKLAKGALRGIFK